MKDKATLWGRGGVKVEALKRRGQGVFMRKGGGRAYFQTDTHIHQEYLQIPPHVYINIILPKMSNAIRVKR